MLIEIGDFVKVWLIRALRGFYFYFSFIYVQDTRKPIDSISKKRIMMCKWFKFHLSVFLDQNQITFSIEPWNTTFLFPGKITITITIAITIGNWKQIWLRLKTDRISIVLALNNSTISFSRLYKLVFMTTTNANEESYYIVISIEDYERFYVIIHYNNIVFAYTISYVPRSCLSIIKILNLRIEI